MRKTLTIIAFGTLLAADASGHAWTVTRNWCGGFFHKRYQSYAQISLLTYTSYPTGYNQIGQYVGTAKRGQWSTICNNDDKGCTRPRTAQCNSSGTGHDYIYNGGLFWGTAFNWNSSAKAVLTTSGQNIYQYDLNGRSYAGLEGEAMLDATALDRLSERGFSLGDVGGNVQAENDRDLVLSNLTGKVTIARNSDYYSKYRILVIKENENESDADAAVSDSLEKIGIFNNVIDSSELYVSRYSMVATGIFAGLTRNQLIQTQSRDSVGYNLNNITLSKNINANLQPGEHLTVVTFADGGFNVSSAIIPPPQGRGVGIPQAIATVSGGVNIYPNPASNSVNCQLFVKEDNTPVSIEVFDILGKQLGVIFTGKLNAGSVTLDKIDISYLPKGIQVLKVKVGNQSTTHKITIE